MNFGYVESQKPTRDERSGVIGVAEDSFNINHVNDVAVHLDIQKTIACRINNRLVKECWLETARDRAAEKKNNSTEQMFHSDHIKTGEISYSKLALHNI